MSGRWWRRGDIEPARPPELTPAEWARPAEALDRLRAWAEAYATATIGWYARDKRLNRLGSRFLRAAAVVLAVAGGVVPLLLVGGPGRPVNAGYVLLALAAGCVAFDHFFGLSTGWMRDITTMQALQAKLVRFQVAWAAWQAAQAGTPTPDREPAVRLVEQLVDDVVTLTAAETEEWITEFQSAVIALRRRTGE